MCCVRRWPDVVLKGLEQDAPTFRDGGPKDAADLGRCRRGVEPLRIVIMPQQDQQTIISPIVEPIPAVRSTAQQSRRAIRYQPQPASQAAFLPRRWEHARIDGHHTVPWIVVTDYVWCLPHCRH